MLPHVLVELDGQIKGGRVRLDFEKVVVRQSVPNQLNLKQDYAVISRLDYSKIYPISRFDPKGDQKSSFIITLSQSPHREHYF